MSMKLGKPSNSVTATIKSGHWEVKLVLQHSVIFPQISEEYLLHDYLLHGEISEEYLLHEPVGFQGTRRNAVRSNLVH